MRTMSFSVTLSKFYALFIGWVSTWFWGSMLHKLLARALYFPSILRMSLIEGPNWRWYDRVDGTVILGALPFKSQTKELVKKENVRAVVSYNESYELKFFTNSREDWARSGVQQHWFSTLDFRPPTLAALWGGVGVMEQCKAQGESIYVHCKAGKGRSATAVVCYLIKAYDFAPSEALEFLRSKRPQISINGRQKKAISEFYRQLKMKSD